MDGVIIAIDPGAGGGIASLEHGSTGVEPMPGGMTGLIDLLVAIRARAGWEVRAVF